MQEGAEGWEAVVAECVAQGTPLALELDPRSSEMQLATRALLATGRVPLPPAAAAPAAPAAPAAGSSASKASKAINASKAGKASKGGKGGTVSKGGEVAGAPPPREEVLLDGAICAVHPAFRLYAFSDAAAPAGVPGEAHGSARVIDARLGHAELAARVRRMVRARTEPVALAALAAARRELVRGQDALEALHGRILLSFLTLTLTPTLNPKP